MSMADKSLYLQDTVHLLNKQWPDNRTVNIVCHGHSVPAGYFATPMVDTFHAYPHLLHRGLKERFPFAVINVIVTAIGGEDSESGAARFEQDVLNHNPDIITIDYGLNDRRIGLQRAYVAWSSMVEQALSHGCKVILLTPTLDVHEYSASRDKADGELEGHARQIRLLAREHQVGLADALSSFRRYADGADVIDLMSWVNHPNRSGHELVAAELLRWFPF